MGQLISKVIRTYQKIYFPFKRNEDNLVKQLKKVTELVHNTAGIVFDFF